MAFDNVPKCLRSLKQWVNWRSEQRKGDKPTKVPVTIAGYDASSTSPADWYSFESVCQHAHKFDGIGFVFTESDDFVGIDIDDCFASPGELKPWAEPIVKALAGTYSEVSPSGNGLKFFCRGQQLDKGRKVAIGDGKLEVYSSGRFFTVTGQVWDDSDCVEIDSDNWKTINAYFPAETQTPKVSPCRGHQAESDKTDRAAKYLETMEPSISGCGGHDACFRAACKMVLGFDLDQESAYGLLASVYNPRCVPPWTEKELRHKVKQADKQCGERGYLLNEPARIDHYPGVDLSGILGAKCRIEDDGTLPDDETFFASMIPNDGLLREIYDYYRATAYKSTPTIGLAVAVSILSTVLGRRVQSHTELRTNDYHIVIAGTSSGKESCEGTTLKILDAAIKNAAMPQGFRMIVPPDVQSGNALLRELSEIKCALWICDEFGKHLQVILDKKQNGNHAAQIGTHLLKIYGKGAQTYHGAAHSAGNKGVVEQPHLCLLGMTTGSVFNSIGVSQIEDGLFGRLSWWPVPKRPERSKTAKPQPVPFELAAQLGLWIKWQPGFQGVYPDPVMIDMDDQSKARWEHHADMIDRKMQDEAEIRAAVWGRVAARAMKLALVHRCARFNGDPASLEDEPIVIEMIDVEWGIKLANWLAKIACELVAENVADPNQGRLRSLIMTALADSDKPQEWFTRKFRKFTSGDIQAAAAELEGDGLIQIREESTGGRPKRIYSMQKTP